MRKIVWIVAAAFALPAGAAFKCVDEKGVTHIGDTEPAACANVMMYEISRSGMVIRAIEPTPTPEQLRAKQEAAEKQKEAARAAAEQKRKDLALLSSFSSDREFDVARERNVEPLTGRIRNSQERIKAVDKRIKELEDEMEFYKAGKKAGTKTREPPPVLVEVLSRTRHEKESLEKGIAANEREIEVLKGKFDADKKRWLELKADPSMRNAQPEAAKAAVAGTMIPGAAGTAKCADKVYECQAGQAYLCRSTRGAYRVDCVVERK
jgi:hypothetical protein